MSIILKLKNIFAKLKIPMVVAVGLLAILFSPSPKIFGGDGIIHADTPTSCGGNCGSDDSCGSSCGLNCGGNCGSDDSCGSSCGSNCGVGSGGGDGGGGENSPTCMCRDAACPSNCANNSNCGGSCGADNCSSQCSSPGLF